MRSKAQAWTWLMVCITGFALGLWGLLTVDAPLPFPEPPFPLVVGMTLSMYSMVFVGYQAVTYLLGARRKAKLVHFDGFPPEGKVR